MLRPTTNTPCNAYNLAQAIASFKSACPPSKRDVSTEEPRRAAITDELASESGGRYRIGKLNVDEHPQIAQHYRIEAIPTLVLFRNGRVV